MSAVEFFLILRMPGSPMEYHDNQWKNQSNFAKMLNQMSEQICLICKEELWFKIYLILQKCCLWGPSAVSKEITEIILICNVMGFFFKFGEKIEENIGFNI